MAYLARLILLLSVTSMIESRWRPCIEVKRELRVPCQCAVAVTGLSKNSLALEVNCDRIILADDALASITGQPIISFSQKSCGHQNLPSQLVGVLPDSLERLDLSGNAINRLMDRQLQGRHNLKELRLANNALGDNLNPIFSSNEFHEVSNLRILDLRSNGLRSIEEGIFKGCALLEELYLDYNDLSSPPIESLKGPKSMKVLSLAGNKIGTIHRGIFSSVGHSLLRLDVSSNELLHLEDGALLGMTSLLVLNISHNEIHHLNSDVFKGAYNLQQLDISTNFLEEFPTDALRYQKDLKFLNISNNLITELDRSHLTNSKELQVLDLSRNSIGRLGVNTFTDLASLVRLDLSFNALRAIEESSFERLMNLKWLSLQDNNILLVPSAALARLPSLVHLHLEYNRIAALSSEILRDSAPNLISFSLNNNLVRELPPKLFLHFDQLLSIELSGNMIPEINQQTFAGIENSLIYLDLSYNRLSAIEEMSLRNLISLNLAGNRLRKISPIAFKHLDRLQYLNISDNPLFGGFPPIFPRSLISLDAARTGLQVLPAILLLNLHSLETVSFSGNKLQELNEGTFKNLFNLTTIDISHNDIRVIENKAFVGLQNLYSLNLRGNKLRAFGGEYFNTGTGLEFLDLSENSLEFLSPTAFLIHPRLREINLSGNRFTQFPSELLKTLQFLEFLNLSKNRLTAVEEFAFAQVMRLRELDLSRNRIESVDELAFHNSTQLQRLDLSRNRLESLNERMMEGVLRMEKLNLMDNRLFSLPETIFDSSRIRSLEKIDLSNNRFAEIPIRTLQKQVSNLVDLNIARNRLSEIFTQDIINSVKYLDLSENPLSENAIRGILSEAKVLRSLNIASCGIHKINKLEAPFLRQLNLSGNTLDYIEPQALERTTMLEELDVSNTKLGSFDSILSAFGTLSALESLDVSDNDIRIINESSLMGFENLRVLKMFSLHNCTRIEKSAFKSLFKLRVLKAYDFPRLGYFDVQGIIKNMKNLEILDIEVKDLNIGNEQLSVRLHPRLRALTVRGDRLQNVQSSLLVGIKASRLSVGFVNTSVDMIPTTLLFPVPRSTQIELDFSGSKFKAITPQLISALDERSGAVKLKGLSLRVSCDCEAKQLWRWYKALESQNANRIVCSTPASLMDQPLRKITEEQLSCESEKSITQSETEHSSESSTSAIRSTVSEPDIIWTVAPMTEPPRNTKHSNGEPSTNVVMGAANSTDDTLIIGIVGGVVAFIAIVVIIICICRLRWGNQVNEARIQAAMASSIHEASMLRPSSTYGCKMNQDIYVSSYNGSTLGHTNNGTSVLPTQSMPTTPVHMLPFVQPVSMIHSPSGAQPIYGYYDNSPVPIYITNPPENKFDR